MKLFLDTNVLLDVVLDRKPHVDYATLLFEKAATSSHTLSTSSQSLMNVHYIVESQRSKKAARFAMLTFMELLEVTAVTGEMLAEALLLDPKDYEDAVQYLSARSSCDAIVTRDRNGFRVFDMEIWTPKEALQRM